MVVVPAGQVDVVTVLGVVMVTVGLMHRVCVLVIVENEMKETYDVYVDV